jgi:glycine/D-amino acid oxidase-like deaminating enzyme
VTYVIVGAGAIGGMLGHHLARAGHEITVVDADAGAAMSEQRIADLAGALR